MRQGGLIKKPMDVVPNHLLEQFAREFMQLYPNARLLVASKEDLSRDRRKMLTAKIASGDGDGIFGTHKVVPGPLARRFDPPLRATRIWESAAATSTAVGWAHARAGPVSR